MKKPKIAWTEEERKNLTARVYLKLRTDPSKTLCQLLKKAQDEVLPANRRRKIGTVNAVPWLLKNLKELFKEEWKKADTVKKEKEEEIRTLKREYEQEKRRKEAEFYKRFEKEREKIKSQIQGKMTFEDLIQEMVKRFENEIKNVNQKLESIQSRMERSSNNNNNQSKKKKIAIVGLIDSQERIIEEKFGKDLDIKFVSKNQSRKEICDDRKYIIMTKFTGHDWINEVRNKTFNYDDCFGGITSLGRILEREINV